MLALNLQLEMTCNSGTTPELYHIFLKTVILFSRPISNMKLRKMTDKTRLRRNYPMLCRNEIFGERFFTEFILAFWSSINYVRTFLAAPPPPPPPAFHWKHVLKSMVDAMVGLRSKKPFMLWRLPRNPCTDLCQCLCQCLCKCLCKCFYEILQFSQSGFIQKRRKTFKTWKCQGIWKWSGETWKSRWILKSIPYRNRLFLKERTKSRNGIGW